MQSDKISILVKKAALHAERIQAPILQEHDLSVSQYKILKHLYKSPKDSIRVVDLEEFFSMTHPAVIDVLKVLEKKGYTTRIVNPEDGRSKIISLTDKAYSMRQELEGLGDEMETIITTNLTEKERETLVRLLRKFLECKKEKTHE